MENIQPAIVTTIPTANIEPNPHNPRRLFDAEPLKVLEESIKKLGILAPLDIYPKKGKKFDPETDKFILLDGERRWRCAQVLKLEKVPVIIISKPSQEQNILTMFHKYDT